MRALPICAASSRTRGHRTRPATRRRGEPTDPADESPSTEAEQRVTPDILQTVIASIALVKEIPAGDITLNQSFEDLGMDSLDGLNVVFELEKAFGIKDRKSVV